MKARNKAKRVARRKSQAVSSGRKDLPRTPSGALSRSNERYAKEAEMDAKDAKAVVLEARQRVHGLAESSAGLAEAGSALGRLYLAGEIKKRLYVAGNRFAEEVARYYALVGLPNPNPKGCWNFVSKSEPLHERDRDKSVGNSLRSVYPEGSPEFREAVKRSADQFMLAMGAIQQADRAGRPIETTVRNVVLLDLDAGNWPPHMIRMLRTGLEALAKLYRIPEHEEEAA